MGLLQSGRQRRLTGCSETAVDMARTKNCRETDGLDRRDAYLEVRWYGGWPFRGRVQEYRR